jgi:phenylacetic acid degradation operon negative regulatory protein
VHALLRPDGTLDAGDLYTVAALLAMSDQQVRLTIKRMVAGGRLTVTGRGRKAILRATADQRRDTARDVEFVRYAYRQDRGLEPWDGTWHLVAFAMPETERSARDALRKEITYLGGAQVQGGLYVSPTQWEPLVAAVADQLGVASAITTATTRDLTVRGVRDPRQLVGQLWPIETIAERWRGVFQVARSRLHRLDTSPPPDPDEALAMAIELAAEFDRAARPDPLLPPDLLPHPWSGTQARELAARAWARLAQGCELVYEVFKEYDQAILAPESAGRG